MLGSIALMCRARERRRGAAGRVREVDVLVRLIVVVNRRDVQRREDDIAFRLVVEDAAAAADRRSPRIERPGEAGDAA